MSGTETVVSASYRMSLELATMKWTRYRGSPKWNEPGFSFIKIAGRVHKGKAGGKLRGLCELVGHYVVSITEIARGNRCLFTTLE